MTMKRSSSFVVAIVSTVVFSFACATADPSGTAPARGSASSSEIRGTVDRIDIRERSITLTNIVAYGAGLPGVTGSTARIFFDERTTVGHQGRAYRPENLERGDQISVFVRTFGDRLFAEAITVTWDSCGGAAGTAIASSVRGIVRTVDTAGKRIDLDTTNLQLSSIPYDAQTVVEFQGERRTPEDLERGDEIEVKIRNLGAGRGFVAESIAVIRSISAAATAAPLTTLRGVVRYVDQRRRAIELEQTTWTSGAESGTTLPGLFLVQYTTSTRVEHRGEATFTPANLERGDGVEIHASQVAGAWVAQRIVVTSDVRTPAAPAP
jgi:hypothetical protein